MVFMSYNRSYAKSQNCQMFQMNLQPRSHGLSKGITPKNKVDDLSSYPLDNITETSRLLYRKGES